MGIFLVLLGGFCSGWFLCLLFNKKEEREQSLDQFALNQYQTNADHARRLEELERLSPVWVADLSERLHRLEAEKFKEERG